MGACRAGSGGSGAAGQQRSLPRRGPGHARSALDQRRSRADGGRAGGLGCADRPEPIDEYQGYGWSNAVHPDDVQPTIEAWDEAVRRSETFVFEHRVRRSTANGACSRSAPFQSSRPDGSVAEWVGVHTDVTEERAAEEALREETRILEALNKTGAALAAQLDLESIVQTVTDAGVELTGAQFGAFFYNVLNSSGESYMLYTLSGAHPSQFDFGMPRNTAVFHPTFAGEGIIRSDDITADPRYGKNDPHFGMPKGHLPVVSYLAVPVRSRSGEVMGGLFFGHPGSRPVHRTP